MRKGNVCSQIVCITGEAGIGKTALVDAYVFTIIKSQ
jgi:predicted ATPase